MGKNDNRKGMEVVKLDLTVEVSKEMLDNPHDICKVKYTVEWGRDYEFKQLETIYMAAQHDLSIDMVMRELGLLTKRIKMIRIERLEVVGKSIAKIKPIEKWEVTNEI